MTSDFMLSSSRAIADGILAIHDHDVVHNDPRYKNIVRDQQDRPRFIDFGHAVVAKCERPEKFRQLTWNCKTPKEGEWRCDELESILCVLGAWLPGELSPRDFRSPTYYLYFVMWSASPVKVEISGKTREYDYFFYRNPPALAHCVLTDMEEYEPEKAFDMAWAAIRKFVNEHYPEDRNELARLQSECLFNIMELSH